jgi:hypothetical protein
VTIAVLVILALLWLAVLAPPAVRFATGERRRADSVEHFNETLSVLGRTNGRRTAHDAAGDRSMTPAQRRRRDVLMGLVGAVTGSLLLALGAGGVFLWALHVVADALLVGYLALLVWFRQLARDRRATLRYLPARETGDDDPLVGRALSSR